MDRHDAHAAEVRSPPAASSLADQAERSPSAWDGGDEYLPGHHAEQEYHVCRTVAATVLAQYKAYPAEDHNGYLNRLGPALRQFSTSGNLRQYHSGADSDDINAFAGGRLSW
jgi:hypothetical protein